MKQKVSLAASTLFVAGSALGQCTTATDVCSQSVDAGIRWYLNGYDTISGTHSLFQRVAHTWNDSDSCAADDLFCTPSGVPTLAASDGRFWRGSVTPFGGLFDQLLSPEGDMVNAGAALWVGGGELGMGMQGRSTTRPDSCSGTTEVYTVSHAQQSLCTTYSLTYGLADDPYFYWDFGGNAGGGRQTLACWAGSQLDLAQMGMTVYLEVTAHYASGTPALKTWVVLNGSTSVENGYDLAITNNPTFNSAPTFSVPSPLYNTVPPDCDNGEYYLRRTTGGPRVYAGLQAFSLTDGGRRPESVSVVYQVSSAPYCEGQGPCTSDFNGDGDSGTDEDIEAFFDCLAGDCCPTCGSADFDGDGDFGTDADIAAFWRVFGGGPC